MATKNATQQGIGDSTIDYYDIMIIGKTGMGKSTTADKLLVANPDGHEYFGSQHSEPDIKGEQMTLDNLSIWILSDRPDEELRVKTRLKNLQFFSKYELELTTMANYFGRAIFECMVVIATLPAEVYEITQGPINFPESSMVKTRKHFDIALSNALPNEKRALPKPPIVFISLRDSCETVFANIEKAAVASNEVMLEFDPMVCARCGIKAQVIKLEKIAAYTGENESSTIPYDESTCHPMLVPKYTTVEKFFGGVAHLLTLKKFLGRWPSFGNLDEACIACQSEPGTRGCMKVNSVYTLKGNDLIVEHTQKTKEPIVFLPSDEPSVSEDLIEYDDIKG